MKEKKGNTWAAGQEMRSISLRCGRDPKIWKLENLAVRGLNVETSNNCGRLKKIIDAAKI